MMTGEALVYVIAPIRLVSEANVREHWRKRASRRKRQRSDVFVLLQATRALSIALPCEVRLCRYSQRTLDTDNLQMAFKSIRDEVSSWIGIDDRSPLISWLYDQMPIKSLPVDVRGENKHMISIEIFRKEVTVVRP